MSELQGLQSNLTSFESEGAQLLAVSVDPPAMGKQISERMGLEFPLLSDPQLQVIDLYGVRHPGGAGESDIARPAIFVVDGEGVIRWRTLTENYRISPRPQAVVEVIRGLK